MHDEAKCLLVFFGCNIGSYHFNVLLVLLLSNIAGVRHAKAKGILVFFGCNVESYHTCPCNNCRYGALSNIVATCVMHAKAKGVLFFLMQCWVMSF
jgi:hypothetical protein